MLMVATFTTVNSQNTFYHGEQIVHTLDRFLIVVLLLYLLVSLYLKLVSTTTKEEDEICINSNFWK